MTGRPNGTETRSVTRRLPPEIFELPVEKMREGYYTDAYFNHTRQVLLRGGRGVGTVPHALIGSYGGNTVLAATKFAENADPDINITVLVDFENDSVKTALDVARALGPRLWGVRLDTSGQLVDRSLWDEMGDFDPRGVNERLVRKVREALDRDGFERVKLVASGGFDAERIAAFERRGVPIDSYGVGSALIRGENDFTADIVMTDGRSSAKAGRRYRPNSRLELVE